MAREDAAVVRVAKRLRASRARQKGISTKFLIFLDSERGIQAITGGERRIGSDFRHQRGSESIEDSISVHDMFASRLPDRGQLVGRVVRIAQPRHPSVGPAGYTRPTLFPANGLRPCASPRARRRHRRQAGVPAQAARTAPMKALGSRSGHRLNSAVLGRGVHHRRPH
jgi:hypothetical protein